jgi:hypothetical protein
VRLASPIGGATGGSGNLSTSLSNVAKQAAHPKFVWVFNANCDGTIIYNDPVDSWLQFYVNIKITIPKKFFFLSTLHPFLLLFCPSCSISLSSIPSPFSISPCSFLSLFLIWPHPFHICSPLLVALSAPSFLFFYLFSLSSFPHLNLAIIFLSLALSLPRNSGISSIINLSYSLHSLHSLILSLFSCLSVSLSLSFRSASIFLLFSIFPLLHWPLFSKQTVSFSF